MDRHRLSWRLASVLVPAAVIAAAQTPASAADPAPAPACVAQVLTFAPGYQVVVNVRNTTAVPVTGWHLTFQLASTATIASSFGGTIARSGSSGTITPAVYFTTIQPGGQANVGFGGSAVPFTPPTGFTLNGAPCAASGW
ncbi:cellulose binding domain-containing protein [Dactylosporangium sp. AC04546]|uniref:cellulose binding domain-containing protein n=1 Tax=Dactylosporangium sp. AC04546 TaxID=2862460 RepID=UPI002E7B9261|nr:cellulose binding domain-containing protein [Dactylosporangium sp. AC04546]WVK87303.1 cellulose binding domain-containing protein [Dactylosporangium sp. AC04546]